MKTDKLTTDTRLGFIGLGYLGSRIAYRLAAAGFPMVVFDREIGKAADLSVLGCDVAENLEDLALEADVLDAAEHERAGGAHANAVTAIDAS